MGTNKINRKRAFPAQDRTEAKKFTILEYIEFSGADEFHKFKSISPVTGAEIAAVDWAELAEQLLV